MIVTVINPRQIYDRGMKWIQQVETSGKLDDELKYYLSESYSIVASGLSKRKQRELGIDHLIEARS